MSACGVRPDALLGGGLGSASRTPQPAPAEVAGVDPALVRGLIPTSFADAAAGVKVEVPQVATARSLTIAMEVIRDRTLRTGAETGAQAVNLTWKLVGSGPGVVGVWLTPTWAGHGATTIAPVAVYYDTATRKTYGSPILIDQQKWGSFKNEVFAAAGREIDQVKLSQALDSQAQPQGIGPALGFDAEGNLVVSFASGVLTAAPLTLRVPASVAAPLLSPVGQRALDAAALPTVFDGTPRDTDTSVAKASAIDNQVPRPPTSIGVDCANTKCVAITFDDGPGTDTPRLLAMLRERKAAVTFFQLGEMIQTNPDIAKQVALSGQEVGSHSMTHATLTGAGTETMNKEVNGTADVFAGVYGHRPLLLRPPGGSHNRSTDAFIARSGAAMVMWDVDTRDWAKRNAGDATSATLKGVEKGGTIVLLHDIHPTSVDAVPAILDGLAKAGVTPVTVSELSLNSGVMEPGHSYCSGTFKEQQAGFGCSG